MLSINLNVLIYLKYINKYSVAERTLYWKQLVALQVFDVCIIMRYLLPI